VLEFEFAFVFGLALMKFLCEMRAGPRGIASHSQRCKQTPWDC
jgi:hypothetical protein